jgi:hypothetical protein
MRKCANDDNLLTPLKIDGINHLYCDESKAPDIGPPENIGLIGNED